jgi:hypothetical protein
MDVFILNCCQDSLNTIHIFSLFQKTMKYFKVFPHLDTEALLSVLHSQKEIRAFKDWQIIYSVSVHAGKTAVDLSVLLRVSTSKIYRKHRNSILSHKKSVKILYITHLQR